MEKGIHNARFLPRRSCFMARHYPQTRLTHRIIRKGSRRPDNTVQVPQPSCSRRALPRLRRQSRRSCVWCDSVRFRSIGCTVRPAQSGIYRKLARIRA